MIPNLLTDLAPASDAAAATAKQTFPESDDTFAAVFAAETKTETETETEAPVDAETAELILLPTEATVDAETEVAEPDTLIVAENPPDVLDAPDLTIGQSPPTGTLTAPSEEVAPAVVPTAEASRTLLSPSQARQMSKDAVADTLQAPQAATVQTAAEQAKPQGGATPAPSQSTAAQALVEGRLPRDIPAAVPDLPEQATIARNIPAAPVAQGQAAPPSAVAVALRTDADKQVLPADAADDVVSERSAKADLPPPASPSVTTMTTAIPMAPPPAVALAQVTQAAQQAQTVESEQRLALAEGDPTQSTLTSERHATTSVTPTGAVPTAGAETARHVANQIAVAINKQSGGPTEIKLNPEELGRVKLSLVSGEGVVTLNLVAERAETQDLLRRHIDVLAQELRNIGFADINFSFGAEGQSSEGETENADVTGQQVTVAKEDGMPDAVGATNLLVTSGLDLRL